MQALVLFSRFFTILLLLGKTPPTASHQIVEFTVKAQGESKFQAIISKVNSSPQSCSQSADLTKTSWKLTLADLSPRPFFRQSPSRSSPRAALVTARSKKTNRKIRMLPRANPALLLPLPARPPQLQASPRTNLPKLLRLSRPQLPTFLLAFPPSDCTIFSLLFSRKNYHFLSLSSFCFASHPPHSSSLHPTVSSSPSGEL